MKKNGFTLIEMIFCLNELKNYALSTVLGDTILPNGVLLLINSYNFLYHWRKNGVNDFVKWRKDTTHGYYKKSSII